MPQFSCPSASSRAHRLRRKDPALNWRPPRRERTRHGLYTPTDTRPRLYAQPTADIPALLGRNLTFVVGVFPQYSVTGPDEIKTRAEVMGFSIGEKKSELLQRTKQNFTQTKPTADRLPLVLGAKHTQNSWLSSLKTLKTPPPNISLITR